MLTFSITVINYLVKEKSTVLVICYKLTIMFMKALLVILFILLCLNLVLVGLLTHWLVFPLPAANKYS
jgi:hypothetical protein